MEAKMAHFFLSSDHDYSRAAFEGSTNPYPFGSVQAKHGRGRAALNRANDYLKSMIHRIADAKVRRMELELGGIYFDASDQFCDERRPGR
jgi:hypothetical protein